MVHQCYFLGYNEENIVIQFDSVFYGIPIDV